ncbi:hypothetical protein FOCC_FOCC004271 [Frankliniella occidentalis]|nr:hypothetical protein FOCC_FOCC004271 [Frankliniella occidentalis]
MKVFVKCPHHPCSKEYNHLGSFTGHLSKKHRAKPSVTPEVEAGAVENNFSNEEEDLFSESTVTDTDPLFEDQNENEGEDDCLMKSFAQFCMKLEFHFLVPEKTVQFSVDEIFKIQSQSKEFYRSELMKTLQSENISIDKVNRIVKYAFANDPFTKQYDQNWKTPHKRKNFYKKAFHFVNPEKIEYVKTITKKGITSNVKTFFYYVDIEKTLQYSFTKDKSLNLDLKPPLSRTDGLLTDVTDGKAFKDNTFFQENPLCIKIIIYQDGVEIVNAIGSAKRIHKLLAIYLSILNLPDHLRSHINSIKLVALCKEKHFDHQIVYGRIVKDLKLLEERGLKLPDGRFVKVGLVCVTGDNLGSHGLGGFVENFSKAVYFCRFCFCDRNTFLGVDGESARFDLRNVASYNFCVHMASRSRDKKNYKGVKFDSVFNQLKAFHVCQPGLPSCLGHDLAEGLVAFDLFLFIKFFVNEAEWFTYHELNEAISSFPYCSKDIKDRPIPVQEDSVRIKGGAWQVWTLLRLFPLIVFDYIDEDNEVFRALILLTEIFEISCSPVIHESHLPYLHTIIDEYLTMRVELFPHVNLRPKHHYLSHYAWQFAMFGPMLKVWTLRFESKHTFFKRVARVIRNFKNILLSLTMKHELLQCYLRSGADFRALVEVFGASDLCLQTYAASIQNVIRSVCPNVSDLQQCEIAIIKGTIYKKSDILVLDQDSYDCKLSLGRVSIILYDCSQDTVYFVCEKLETSYDIKKRLYRVGTPQYFTCVKPDQLLTYYPHKVYLGSYVKLKHAIVCRPA